MSENVQLQKVLIDLVIIEVSRYDVSVPLVGRFLYRTELIYLVVVRNDDDTSRMLSGRPLDARAAFHKIVYVVFVSVYMIVFDVVLYISESGLVGYCSYRSGLIYVLFTEDLAHVSVCDRLVFTRKVKVYIRLLVALESEEGSERDVETFFLHACAALRACLLRHIVAYIVFARFVRPLKMPALRTDIVRSERIYLRDACHGGGKRRAYRASGSYQISVLVRLVNEHLCSYIHHGISVSDDGAKFSLQPFLYFRRQRIAVY